MIVVTDDVLMMGAGGGGDGDGDGNDGVEDGKNHF